MSDKELKKAGLKITAPRINVLKILTEAGDSNHLSAEDIYINLTNQNIEIGLATVYRILNQFEVAGLVIRHQFEPERAVYEINNGTHHDHIVCTKCGLIEEFVDDIIEERQIKIAKKFNFEITDHSLYLYGVCNNCK